MFVHFLQEIRLAVRLLRRSPIFTITAVLLLAIAIGANTTIFSIVSALLLRPLPGINAPQQIVDIGRTQEGKGFDTTSWPNYLDIRARVQSLEGIYAYNVEPSPMGLAGTGEAERVYGTVVSSNYFNVLGAHAALGRVLQDSDDSPGSAPVVVLGHELWQRHFASDKTLVGRTITLNGSPFTVVGVAMPGFQGTTVLKPDIWVPMSHVGEAVPRLGARILKSRGSLWLMMGGRVKPTFSLRQVDAELSLIAKDLERQFPTENQGKGLHAMKSALVPGRAGTVAAFMALLMGIVGVVLLTACMNLSSMLLARSGERSKEMAVRAAIGAKRSQIIGQLLTEIAVLYLLGGIAGIFLTRLLTPLLLALVPRLPVQIGLEIGMDWSVVLFALLVTAAAALLSGLAPAIHSSKVELATAMKTESATVGGSRLRLRNFFIAAQIALSLPLVIVAGLFVRSLQSAANVAPGFDQSNVEVVSLDLSMGRLDQTSGNNLLSALVERTRALPGAEAAAITTDLPLDGGIMGFGELRPAGGAKESAVSAIGNAVGPGLFRTLKLPLLAGRDFSESDTQTSLKVTIVNQALARRFWPGQTPLGMQMELRDRSEDKPTLWTVVGIATDAKLISLNENAGPYVYLPLTQMYLPRVSLMIRSVQGSNSIPAVRGVMRSLAPNVPITEIAPLHEITALGLVPQVLAAAVSGSLGLVAVLLAGIGIYGVTAYAVNRRGKEIAVRMALGATPANVTRLVLRQGLLLAGIGTAVGLLLAALASKVVQGQLFGVAGLDPLTFGGAVALFGTVTLAANFFPAKRASETDPMRALRNE